jgi:hypothetical protein
VTGAATAIANAGSTRDGWRSLRLRIDQMIDEVRSALSEEKAQDSQEIEKEVYSLMENYI